MFTELPFYIHIGSLFVAGAGVLWADTLGFSWVRGKVATLPQRDLSILHRVMGVALGTLIVTGAYMFWPMRDYLLQQPLFYIKIAFVAALVINAFVINTLMHVSTRTPFRSLSHAQKVPLMLSGAVSLVCWIGAGVTALILF